MVNIGLGKNKETGVGVDVKVDLRLGLGDTIIVGLGVTGAEPQYQQSPDSSQLPGPQQSDSQVA